MSGGSRNEYRQELVGFGNWCVETHRLSVNPFANVPKADANSDRRRQRRSMTEAELVTLLDVARLRPLAEFGREAVSVDEDETEANGNPAKRSNWTKAVLTLDGLQAAVERARGRLAKNAELVAELERLGRERALIYKTLVLTGLRKGELASLTVGQLELDEPMPFAVLNVADKKNRQGSTLPLRTDLAAELREIGSARSGHASKGVLMRLDANRCSLSRTRSGRFSTATCSPPGSTRPTSGAEPSTFKLCGIRSERCCPRGALLRERLKRRCVTATST